MIDAQTTLNQLTQSNNGGQRLVVMVGAKNILQSQSENFVSFKFMKGPTNKSNYMKITLNAMDTYDVEFGYIYGMNYTVRSEHNGVYDDMLKDLFESETGLRLKM